MMSTVADGSIKAHISTNFRASYVGDVVRVKNYQFRIHKGTTHQKILAKYG